MVYSDIYRLSDSFTFKSIGDCQNSYRQLKTVKSTVGDCQLQTIADMYDVVCLVPGRTMACLSGKGHVKKVMDPNSPTIYIDVVRGITILTGQ